LAALYRARNLLFALPIFNSVILPALPRPVRWTLRRLYFLPADLIEKALGREDDLVPPKSEIFVGAVDTFRRSGDILLERLVDVAGLAPDARVLDIGCGIGRLAVPLTRFLAPTGAYEGLDIVPGGIRWCREHITRRYPNFRFTLADVYNKEYHPAGRQSASAYRFPYPDESFDLVVLISVFTHMLPADMEQYVAEIARVLKPGGRCFATYLLINEESLRLMASGAAALRYEHYLGPHWVLTPKVPEYSVAYDEPAVHACFERFGLGTKGTTYYGGWCGRPAFWFEESGLGDHDVVIGTKAQAIQWASETREASLQGGMHGAGS
jgi:ubiquinone/menaquinone biosynthesis C-methylase UbiE